MITLTIEDQQNPNKTQVVTLQPEATPNRECTIGRAETCELLLDSQEISRCHAKIVYTGYGAYRFSDLGSSGGSILNTRSIIAHQEYELKAGDILTLGRFNIGIFQIGNPDENTVVTRPIEPQPADFMPVYAIAPADFPRWKGDTTVRCAAIIDEAPSVKTFRFVADAPILFNYKPGQFVTLNLNINGEEVLRSYSISSTPSRPHTLEITVKRVPADQPELPPGLVSNWLHDNLRVGDAIAISGPLGKFSCWQHPSHKLLFISGGSGITPMMSMSRWLCDTVANCDVVFLHSAKTPAEVIYHPELMLLAARHHNFQPIITVTNWQSGQGWMGLRGRITTDSLKSIIPDFMERRIFVCGPNAFMAATKEIAVKLGFPMERYHEESFGTAKKFKPIPQPQPQAQPAPGSVFHQIFQAAPASPPPVAIAAPAVPASTPPAAPVAASAISVTFQKSSQKVAADGSSSILDLAEENSVKIRSSCRAGVCGTCKKKKVSGNIKMTDFDEEALEPSEQAEGFILTCVAFPLDEVTIDA